MNLLTDPWIPIQEKGHFEKITLQQLLCGEKTGEICLPRDDMELACLQLLCTITQVLFTPENKRELGHYVKQALTQDDYQTAIQGKLDWFDLDHPETPFMQFRGVKAKEPTPMDKLMAGLSGGENKVFVNEMGLADNLCSGCVAIALFNSANNCPNVGGGNLGGFKAGLRGSTPITLLIQGRNLRETIWLNVLTEETLNRVMPWYDETRDMPPNYIKLVKAREKISVSEIGLARGLLWQPARYELFSSNKLDICSCCGLKETVYDGFKKEQFGYTIEGVWPHPLSSRTFSIKKKKEEFPSFTTTAPTWTHMSRLLIDRQSDKEGQQAAPIIQQARTFIASAKLQLIIGGYRNNQATILERRHELFSLAQGWHEHGEVIQQIIHYGLEYKKALRKALYLFAVGIKDKVHGSGVNLCDPVEANYYQQTEGLLHTRFASVHFEQPDEDLTQLKQQLKTIVKNLFDQATEPYQQEPKMIKALAMARRSLHKSMKDLEPEGETHDKN